MINYIKLYFICVTYGLPYFLFRFISLRFFLFFSFSFVSFLFSLFCFHFFCVSFFSFLFVTFPLVFFSFFFFPFLFVFSVSQFTGTLKFAIFYSAKSNTFIPKMLIRYMSTFTFESSEEIRKFWNFLQCENKYIPRIFNTYRLPSLNR